MPYCEIFLLQVTAGSSAAMGGGSWGGEGEEGEEEGVREGRGKRKGCPLSGQPVGTSAWGALSPGQNPKARPGPYFGLVSLSRMLGAGDPHRLTDEFKLSLRLGARVCIWLAGSLSYGESGLRHSVHLCCDVSQPGMNPGNTDVALFIGGGCFLLLGKLRRALEGNSKCKSNICDLRSRGCRI